VQPPEDVDGHVLDHVVGVGHAARTPAQTAAGEALERAAIATHQDLPGGLVAAARPRDEIHRGCGIDRHRHFHDTTLLFQRARGGHPRRIGRGFRCRRRRH
jgi:hypothetical protein